jgi:transglutaminase-like putative cysteine protease
MYSIEPAERTLMANGAEQLMFDLEMAPREEKIIHLQWEIQLTGLNALAQTNPQALSAEDRQRYLEAGTLYESDNPEIIAKTNAVIAEKSTELEKANAIFAFVRSHVKFFRFGADSKGALYALQNGRGDCTEYAALIVAMSRAAGIPARLNGVMAFNKADTGKAGTDNHNNAEVFIAGHGWVPAEATFKNLAFGQMANFEVILRRGLRTDKNGWVSWKVASDAAKIKDVKMLGHKWQKLL